MAAEHLLCQGVPVFPGVRGSYAALSPPEAQVVKRLCSEVLVRALLRKNACDACRFVNVERSVAECLFLGNQTVRWS